MIVIDSDVSLITKWFLLDGDADVDVPDVPLPQHYDAGVPLPQPIDVTWEAEENKGDDGVSENVTNTDHPLYLFQ